MNVLLQNPIFNLFSPNIDNININIMKNTSKTSVLIPLAALLIMGCQEQPKTEAATQLVAQEESVEAPDEIISLDEAKTLCENYETRRIPGIRSFEKEAGDTEGEFIPTQFVAFNLKTLKQYIKYVEQEAGKAKVAPDSLRIYLGNYGKEGKDPNRNTVFILPTAEIGKEYGGFYIGEDGEAKLIRNYWPKSDEDGQEGGAKSEASLLPVFPMMMNGDGSLVMNRGGSGPPPHTDF